MRWTVMPAGKAAYIAGSAVFLPNAPVGNDDMETLLGRVGGKSSRARAIVLRNNGIRQRYYAIDPLTGQPTHSNAQLTAEAIRALGRQGFPLDQIDCLVTGTSCPDQLMPNHGVMVHGELRNPSCEVISTAGICVAGVTALKYAWMSVLTGQARHAVATGSELASAMLHARNFTAESDYRVGELEEKPEIAFEKDFLRWMLSDGAGALWLQSTPQAVGLSLRIDWIDITSRADQLAVCMYAGGDKRADGSLAGWQQYPAVDWLNNSIFAVKQDVRLLNDEVVKQTLAYPLDKVMRQRGLNAADVDWFLPHMSSEYFRQPMQACMEALGFPVAQEKWFTNLHTRGNTGSASIYIMLDELLHSGKLVRGQKLLCFIPESGRFTGAFMHLTVVDHAG
jgi:3-oxoacyl-[acyl-carrier-protein] synthase-3